MAKRNGSEMRMLIGDWQFKRSDEQDWLAATVPGCVHTDLRANNQLLDPFKGKNELKQQWVDKKDWEYQITFDIADDLLKKESLEIVFHGLDTYATVYVNDQIIIEANNMFRTWRADIKPLVKKEENHLRVYFRSPINEDIPKLKELGYGLPAVNDDSETGELGEQKVSVFARKAPYHYGWDWGPRFVTSGIWKDVEIIGWSKAVIADLYIHQQEVSADRAQLRAEVEIESTTNWQGTIEVAVNGQRVSKTVQLETGRNRLELDLVLEQPKLWWSRGLGEPSLYTFEATLLDDEQTVAEKAVQTGLRSVRLVRDPDKHGTSFYFELNGVPVFAKGANHIPNDSFVTDVSYARYEQEINGAVEANMNMLRVWGGGIYESDDFYQLCDENGLLVWQDFMFACSMYPGDQAFLTNIEAEAEDVIKRLRKHPCILLWCGNNEIDSAWAHYNEKAGWGWKNDYPVEIREKIWGDYQKIFHDILADAVTTFAPTVPYWPSSPMSTVTGNIDQHATEVTASGDVHYWDVWHGKKPFEDYNTHVGRFMSEYGFQSFPEWKTVRTYAEEKDFALESDVMLHHQKNGAGNRLIKTYMDKYLAEPKSFPAFLYLSQVLQAEGVKGAIEAHRRHKPYCMGTLYWQLNDCWPVASWSSIDYYGRWKALHYYVKKSFQDVMVSFDENEQQIIIYTVSDVLDELAVELKLEIKTFSGEVLDQQTQQISVKPNTSQGVVKLAKDKLLAGRNKHAVVLVAQLCRAGQVIDQKEHYFAPIKALTLTKPTIELSEVDGAYRLTTDVLAKQVRLSTEEEGFFSDNYFDLIPGQAKSVQFVAKDTETKENKSVKIRVNSMTDFI